MDIIVDIQDFRDAEKKFIPKEVVAIDAPIVNHWITITFVCRITGKNKARKHLAHAKLSRN